MFGRSALNDRIGSQVEITHLVNVCSAGVALGVTLLFWWRGLLFWSLVVGAFSSSEVSSTRGLERQVNCGRVSFLWLHALRFCYGAHVGAGLFQVRVYLTGWLLVYNVPGVSFIVCGG